MKFHEPFTDGGNHQTGTRRGYVREPVNPITARCGYRCDLCPAYRENVGGPENQQRTSDGWFKYYGFRIAPEQIRCDGCLDERPEARRIDTTCPIRPCAIARGLSTCARCPDCGCKDFESRTVTRERVEQRIGAPVPPEDYQWFVLPYERHGFLARAQDEVT